MNEVIRWVGETGGPFVGVILCLLIAIRFLYREREKLLLKCESLRQETVQTRDSLMEQNRQDGAKFARTLLVIQYRLFQGLVAQRKWKK
jgi:hypothetical protein